jgi:hypothetical protein
MLLVFYSMRCPALLLGLVADQHITVRQPGISRSNKINMPRDLRTYSIITTLGCGQKVWRGVSIYGMSRST